VIRLSSADTETDTAAEEATERDPRREEALERIALLLGDDLVGSHLEPNRELFLRVAPDAWKRTLKTLRDELGFKFFEFLSAIDWMPSPFGKSEDSAADAGVLVTSNQPGPIETGHAGGDTRFQVFARLVDITRHSLGVTIKTDVPDEGQPDAGTVESVTGVFPGANWHERETWEMFGIRFAGHPYLEKLYLPTGFEGHPLRKDFPLLARHVKPWPGIVDVEPMPDEGDDSEDGGDDS
jgi:NADH-quinone oxidoreductase subunit C